MSKTPFYRVAGGSTFDDFGRRVFLIYDRRIGSGPDQWVAQVRRLEDAEWIAALLNNQERP